ncbi:hypothetical protein IEO70_02260 [Bacillus sp. AGMB 02131]|uniref:Uncharacterized protein n=1 Tax=Peribacillus faecalis TaxID=2772559 RepID=A0A927CTK2_9BACI|nr:hypothetical protein [Peribacillus faecalis]MBD3107191.1 hypothetical protein [Peribacillus faecalis]
MAFVNKKKVTIGLTEEVSTFAKEKAKSIGMSMSVYIETLLRKEMEKEKENG